MARNQKNEQNYFNDKMFSFMILKHTQMKNTVILCFLHLVLYCRKFSSSRVYRGSTEVENTKLKKNVRVCKGEVCIDEMLTHLNKWKGDPEIQ